MFEDVSNLYDRASETYDERFTRPIDRAEDEWVRAKCAPLTRLNTSKAGFNPQVLDLGCGTGWLLDQVKCIPPSRYLGLDISKGMISQAVSKYPDYNFGVEDMAATKEPTHYYDSVISTYGALSYHEYPEHCALEIGRVLKPGGRFLVMAYGPSYRHRHTYIMRDKNSRLQFYTSEKLKALFPWAEGVKVQGLNGFSESFKNSRFVGSILRFEAATIGRFAPDLCYSLVITGRKPCPKE